MKTRIFHIDVLRAIAIVGVMLTHSLALFLGPPIINSIWNYLHFVVVGFVFCSGYVISLTFKRNNLLVWYWKRFIRLYLPFVAYVFAFMLIKGIDVPSRFLFDSLTFVGGADVGWLTLLFLQLAILTPLLIRIGNNERLTKTVLLILGLFTLITLLLRIPSVYSRMVAWIPWSLIFLLGSIFAKDRKETIIRSQYLLLGAAVCGIAWLVLGAILTKLQQPLTLTLHKYPPDVYYFLYGISINSLLLFASQRWKNPGIAIIKTVTFISKHSYGMFFTHLLILEVMTRLIRGITVIPIAVGSIAGTFGILYGWSLLLSFSKHYVSTVNPKR